MIKLNSLTNSKSSTNGFKFYIFSSRRSFFAAGKGKAQLTDLVRGSSKEFDNVKQAEILSENHNIFMLDNDEVFSVYSYE